MNLVVPTPSDGAVWPGGVEEDEVEFLGDWECGDWIVECEGFIFRERVDVGFWL